MKTPRLSIIIPVYQVKPYLGECLDSVLHPQTPGCEIILIDDGSTDGGESICDEYATRFLSIKVIHQNNQGLSAARNEGIKSAQGEYVTFVDSDDRLESNTFALLLDELDNHPDTDILEYPIYIYYQSPEANRWNPKEERTITGDILREWILKDGYNRSFACNKIFRRTLFTEIGFPNGKHYEDLLTIPYLLKGCHNYRTTQRGLYYYYAREKSISQTFSFEKSRDLFEGYYLIYQIAQKKGISEKQILLSTYLADWLTDMIRCDRKRALSVLQSYPIEKNSIRNIIPSSISLTRKVKAICIGLFGLKTHALLYAQISNGIHLSRKIWNKLIA